MTPEEREDLQDIEASVMQIVRLVQAGDADTSLSAGDAGRIAEIAKQTVDLVQDLLAESEEEGESPERAGVLRRLLDQASAADALATAIRARKG